MRAANHGARSAISSCLDRRRPGEEASFGNGGLVQREAVLPHPFPRELAELRRTRTASVTEKDLVSLHDLRDAGASGEATGASRGWQFGDEQGVAETELTRALRDTPLRLIER